MELASNALNIHVETSAVWILQIWCCPNEWSVSRCMRLIGLSVLS